MQNLISYTFKDVEIRTTLKNDAPWFAMADVAKALNYTHTPDAVRILDEDEKDVQIMHTPSGDQKLTIINESGLYSLILRSRKPEAKAFKKFVTSVVLPSIRKTGQYVDRSRFAELPFDPVPYTPADFVGDKEFMKALGGIVKKCCAVAIREELKKDNPTSIHAIGALVDYISEKRTEQLFAEWKNKTQKQITQVLS